MECRAAGRTPHADDVVESRLGIRAAGLELLAVSNVGRATLSSVVVLGSGIRVVFTQRPQRLN